MNEEKCQQCKMSEFVKRPGQKPKLKCDVILESVYIEKCPKDLKAMNMNDCLDCKYSVSVYRTIEKKAKLECSIIDCAIEVLKCIGSKEDSGIATGTTDTPKEEPVAEKPKRRRAKNNPC